MKTYEFNTLIMARAAIVVRFRKFFQMWKSETEEAYRDDWFDVAFDYWRALVDLDGVTEEAEAMADEMGIR